MLNIEECEYYSGAAKGADSYWGERIRVIGGKVIDYTPNDWDKLPALTKQRMEREYLDAVKKLGRKVLDKNSYNGKLVRRDMIQVEACDAVFAIGYLEEDRIRVKGGTGYAIEKAKTRNIPIYIYEQNQENWFYYDYEDGLFHFYAGANWCIDINHPPKLTKYAALIGSRDLQECGKQAINDIIYNTFNY